MSDTYGVCLFVPDPPMADELLLLHVVGLTATLPAGFSGSRASVDSAATTTRTIPVRHNGALVATVTFSPGALFGVFSAAAPVVMQPGDWLTVQAPSSEDATFQGLALTLLATRGSLTNLRATLSVDATLSATLHHANLAQATLGCRASLSGRLLPANRFAATLLACEANLTRAVLTDCETLHADLRTDTGAELVGRLTVTHDASLYR